MPGLTDTHLHLMRGELRQIYPWAPKKALDEATDLIADQLNAHEGQRSYTMARYERALAASKKLAELVGPAPKQYRGAKDFDALTFSEGHEKSFRPHNRAAILRRLSNLGKSLGHGGDEHRGLER
ncbi:hypothetical protein [Mycolicibacterium sp. CBMA 226]|uniref:hypothetical protein n=1 Tax=Mycolicibacterium sp. CBMA 226 TaxID=2606611 RepID=UPI0012DDEC48|nr:hypothetical protein [Mycolicibacterium sp. CBMA 226]MUL78791.1 hypothetical protein [Mycolicibacterium sp. CBMA 226]QGW61083.1 hypothetical protein ICEMyc226_00051 [Mycolicibacterium sp.]